LICLLKIVIFHMWNDQRVHCHNFIELLRLLVQARPKTCLGQELATNGHSHLDLPNPNPISVPSTLESVSIERERALMYASQIAQSNSETSKCGSRTAACFQQTVQMSLSSAFAKTFRREVCVQMQIGLRNIYFDPNKYPVHIITYLCTWIYSNGTNKKINYTGQTKKNKIQLHICS
jgi:hypothetical protein